MLFLAGAGGHGAEVASYLLEAGLALAGVLDDGKTPGPWHVSQILGPLSSLVEHVRPGERAEYLTAFGSNSLRQEVVKRLNDLGVPGLSAMTLVHPRAWVAPDVRLGEGCLVAPLATISVRCAVGRHVIVNLKSSLSHDSVVGDWCNINPSATVCGGVTLGDSCFIGAGATVLEGRTVGAGTVVGAGAVVTRDLPAGVTAVGVPARIIRTHAPAGPLKLAARR